MKNIIHTLLEHVDAEQLMQVIEAVAHDQPEAVIRAFDDVLGGNQTVHGPEESTLSPDQHKELKDMCAGDRKVAAIKLLREWTGSGLKEAKDWIEENCF